MSEDAHEEAAELVVEFEVAASVEHAFDTWVSRIEMWWPRDHTLSKEPAAIMVEPRVGGRIFERVAGGDELAWGEVLAWDPPHGFRWLWHLFFARADATEVEVTFTPSASGTTVRLVQTGWDALGDRGVTRREHTLRAWTYVTTGYRHLLGNTP